MKKLLIISILLVAVPGLAAVPHVFNYQGYVSDLEGSPLEGNYSLVFRIYDVAAGADPALWTETHPVVPVTDGVFSVLLGSLVDLPATVLAEDALWIGVTVGIDSEIAPRLQVTSTPWAYRAAIADSSVVTGAGGGDGGTVFNVATGSGLTGGPITTSGILSVANSGITATHLASNSVYGSKILDSSITGADIASNTITASDIATNGVGASEIAAGAVGASEIADNSITNVDIFDEPGISQYNSTNVNIAVTSNAVMTDIVTTSITIPAPGYIVVEGGGTGMLSGVTTQNYIYYQIDETAGGGLLSGRYHMSGGYYPTTGFNYVPLYERRTYYKSSAGTYTFRLEAMAGQATGSKWIRHPVVTAMYLPKSYGSVNKVVGANEAGRYDNAQPAASSGPGVDGINGGAAFVVDLNELERRAASAARDLAEAREAAMEQEIDQ